VAMYGRLLTSRRSPVKSEIDGFPAWLGPTYEQAGDNMLLANTRYDQAKCVPSPPKYVCEDCDWHLVYLVVKVLLWRLCSIDDWSSPEVEQPVSVQYHITTIWRSSIVATQRTTGRRGLSLHTYISSFPRLWVRLWWVT